MRPAARQLAARAAIDQRPGRARGRPGVASRRPGDADQRRVVGDAAAASEASAEAESHGQSAGVVPRHGGVDPVGRAIISMASAASSTHTAISSRVALGRPGQHVVDAALRAAGRLADPDADADEVLGVQVGDDRSSPLWPARPPPSLIFIRPGSRSSSSWTTTRRAGILDAVAPHQRRRRPGPSRSCRWSGRRAPPGACPIRTSATRAGRVLGRLQPLTVAARPAARPRRRRRCGACRRAPCPGLPRPTTSRSDGVPRRGARRRRRLRPSDHDSGVGVGRRRRRSAPSAVAVLGAFLAVLAAPACGHDGGPGERGGDHGRARVELGGDAGWAGPGRRR